MEHSVYKPRDTEDGQHHQKLEERRGVHPPLQGEHGPAADELCEPPEQRERPFPLLRAPGLWAFDPAGKSSHTGGRCGSHLSPLPIKKDPFPFLIRLGRFLKQ